MNYLLPIALGISLAAATGFRVFLPLLITGLAAREGYLPMTESMSWLATTPALLMLAVAATAFCSSNSARFNAISCGVMRAALE